MATPLDINPADPFARSLNALRATALAEGPVTAYQNPAAMRAGLEAVQLAESISIARQIDPADPPIAAGDGRPRIELTCHQRQDGVVAAATDRLSVWCHSYSFTHLDAPGHIEVEGFDDHGPITDPQRGPLWSLTGLVTRAVFLDVPRWRGVSEVAEGREVTAAELEELTRANGIAIRSGDAVLLYGGRDVWEETATTPTVGLQPRVSRDVALWLADHGVSTLCWDFMDAPRDDRMQEGPHLLIWAVGLPVIDNCDFRRLKRRLDEFERTSGLLVVAPLPIKGATGCLVNPLVLI